jgi:hypothetical protein
MPIVLLEGHILFLNKNARLTKVAKSPLITFQMPPFCMRFYAQDPKRDKVYLSPQEGSTRDRSKKSTKNMTGALW